MRRRNFNRIVPLAALLSLSMTACRRKAVLEVVYELAPGAVLPAGMERRWQKRASEVIRARLKDFGGAEVVIEGDGIVVRVPVGPNFDDSIITDLTVRPGTLEFLPTVDASPVMDALVRDLEGPPAALGIKIVRNAGPVHLEAVDRATLEATLADRAPAFPAGQSIGFETLKVGDRGWRTHVLDRGALALIQPAIRDARVVTDQYGSFQVSLSFDRSSGEKFADLTGAIVGRNLAIVLDGTVQTAPMVMDKISGGQATITLGRVTSREESGREAEEIARVLRAGALPAPLQVKSTRVIAP